MTSSLSGSGLRIAVVIASLLVFLVAAKAHGRQLRLERQLADHWEVSFVRQNHPWVEAFWKRERVVYWSMALGLAVLGLAGVLLARRMRWPVPLARGTASGWSWWGAALAVVLWPLVIALVVHGLMSLARFLVALPAQGPPAARAEWIMPALWGSAGWWLLTLALLAGVAALSWRPVAVDARGDASAPPAVSVPAADGSD